MDTIVPILSSKCPSTIISTNHDYFLHLMNLQKTCETIISSTAIKTVIILACTKHFIACNPFWSIDHQNTSHNRPWSGNHAFLSNLVRFFTSTKTKMRNHEKFQGGGSHLFLERCGWSKLVLSLSKLIGGIGVCPDALSEVEFENNGNRSLSLLPRNAAFILYRLIGKPLWDQNDSLLLSWN